MQSTLASMKALSHTAFLQYKNTVWDNFNAQSSLELV